MLEKLWYYAFYCGNIYFIFSWNWVFTQPKILDWLRWNLSALASHDTLKVYLNVRWDTAVLDILDSQKLSLSWWLEISFHFENSFPQSNVIDLKRFTRNCASHPWMDSAISFALRLLVFKLTINWLYLFAHK